MKRTFEDWIEDLKSEMADLNFNKNVIDSIDIESYRTYYDDDYTPRDAVIEEMRT